MAPKRTRVPAWHAWGLGQLTEKFMFWFTDGRNLAKMKMLNTHVTDEDWVGLTVVNWRNFEWPDKPVFYNFASTKEDQWRNQVRVSFIECVGPLIKLCSHISNPLSFCRLISPATLRRSTSQG